MNVTQEAVKHFEEQGENFADALFHCLLYGHVIKRPDFLLMATEVLAWPDKGIVSTDPKGPFNCWYLWVLIHSLGKYTAYDYQCEAPFPHRYVAYKRRGRTFVREWERLSRDFNSRVRGDEMDKLNRRFT